MQEVLSNIEIFSSILSKTSKYAFLQIFDCYFGNGFKNTIIIQKSIELWDSASDPRLFDFICSSSYRNFPPNAFLQFFPFLPLLLIDLLYGNAGLGDLRTLMKISFIADFSSFSEFWNKNLNSPRKEMQTQNEIMIFRWIISDFLKFWLFSRKWHGNE